MSGSNLGQWATGVSLNRGLLGWYKQQGSLADASGNGNTYLQAVGTGLSNAGAATDKFGNSLRAWGFGGGSATYITKTHYDVTRPITYSFWLQPTASVNQNAVIMGEGYSADDTSRLAVKLVGREIAISMINSSGTALIDQATAVTNTASLVLNAWKHVIATIDPVNGTYAIYLDGVSTKTGTWSGTMTTLDRHSTGGSYGLNVTQRVNATVCDLRIYGRALTDVEISSLVNSTFRL